MHEIDKFRTDLIGPDLHIWGWQIAVYLFLGGMTAGLMIVAPMLGRKLGTARLSRAARLLPFAAPLILSIGMFALFLDLEHKLHVFRFYTAFRITSPMSWGSWILLLIYPATMAFGLSQLNDEEAGAVRRFMPRLIASLFDTWMTWSRGASACLGRINIALGVALGAYTGILLGTLGARALWSSILLAPLFLVSGFSAGAAATMLLPLKEEEHEALRRWDVAAILGEIGMLALLFIDLSSGGGEHGRAAVAMFFGGAYTGTFWAFVIVAGLAAPLILDLAEEKRQLRSAAIAPVLLLIGSLALRWIFVLAGQANV